MTNDRQKPDGARVVLHAAAMVFIGAIHHAVGAIIGRIIGWFNEHVDEGPWIARGTAYNQRAFRIIRPWWQRNDKLARWHAQRADEQARRPQ